MLTVTQRGRYFLILFHKWGNHDPEGLNNLPKILWAGAADPELEPPLELRFDHHTRLPLTPAVRDAAWLQGGVALAMSWIVDRASSSQNKTSLKKRWSKRSRSVNAENGKGFNGWRLLPRYQYNRKQCCSSPANHKVVSTSTRQWSLNPLGKLDQTDHPKKQQSSDCKGQWRAGANSPGEGRQALVTLRHAASAQTPGPQAVSLPVNMKYYGLCLTPPLPASPALPAPIFLFGGDGGEKCILDSLAPLQK